MQAIEKFCKASPDTIRPFQSGFVILSDKPTKNAQAMQGTGTDIAAYSHLKPLAKDVYPDEINKLLLDGVRNSASCVPNSWNANRERYASHQALSQFRFSIPKLNGPFNIITATSKMACWQEMAIAFQCKSWISLQSRELKRHRKEIEEKDTPDLENCKSIVFDASKLSLVECGAVCKRLENPSYAKIYLGMLTP